MGSRTRQNHQSEQQAIGQEHTDDVDVVDGLRRGMPSHYGSNISLKQRPTPINEREKGSDIAAPRLGPLRFRGQRVWVTRFLGRRPL